MLKKYIKKGVLTLFSLLPLDSKKVMFESNSEIKDNSKALFLKCLDLELNNKYKIIWGVENPQKYKEDYKAYKNIRFIKKKKTGFPSLVFLYHCCTAKYCFYTHNLLGQRIRKGQRKIFLTHGIPIKDTRGMFWAPYENTDIISTSEFAAYLRCKTFGGGDDIVKLLGFPRNDFLFKTDKGTEEYFNKIKKGKFIIWLPTFKRHNISVNRHDFDEDKDTDISILSPDFMEKLNNYLKTKDILLLIKYHPSQNLDYVSLKSYSNIITLTNDQLEKNNVDLYSLMGKSDALITDFSSVYIDYLLVDKPIAFELGDYKSYKNGRGFIVDNPLDFMPGEKINNPNDLYTFIDNVFNGVDKYQEERKNLKNKMHKYVDGNSSERVLDYFELIN
ncbi:CDP-glycerol glycerophosphotransferase family protein [Streptococcus equinus]|uniref:CDP-glycerol glycerophosphotransferase family protein n=1 Tax=Streptococcus equinus TaxID=1335 RepID=UPI003EE89C8D